MIILVRHAQSEGNADPSLFEITPDHKFNLTQFGVEQANMTGDAIYNIVKSDRCIIYSSPYLRTMQTANIIQKRLPNVLLKIIEDVRLRERNMGHSKSKAEMDEIMARRREFGKFHFPFENGESGLNVYDRVASFMDYLLASSSWSSNKHAIIVTHSYTMRVILMYMMALSIEGFETLTDPGNGDWISFGPHIFQTSRYHSSEKQPELTGSYSPLK